MSSATGTALALCNGLYLVVALGACVAFGPSLEPDLLASMSRAQLQPLIGAAAGQALTLVLRLGWVGGRFWGGRGVCRRFCFSSVFLGGGGGSGAVRGVQGSGGGGVYARGPCAPSTPCVLCELIGVLLR